MVRGREGVGLAEGRPREDGPAVATLLQGTPTKSLPRMVQPKASRCSAVPSDIPGSPALLALLGLVGFGVVRRRKSH